MMRNHALPDQGHARGRRSAPSPAIKAPPFAIILWVMREVQRFTDPKQHARWWMYRSWRMTTPQSDPTCLASRTERVTDAVLALPAAFHEPRQRSFRHFTAKR
ncbi:hypothetical protein ZWY2020_042179 [Hordeum vulgare]|nr:hypothetical protein ZWY2020_042179 [Hordeum vulgare]